jgi:hypothetical protein
MAARLWGNSLPNTLALVPLGGYSAELIVLSLIQVLLLSFIGIAYKGF